MLDELLHLLQGPAPGWLRQHADQGEDAAWACLRGRCGSESSLHCLSAEASRARNGIFDMTAAVERKIARRRGYRVESKTIYSCIPLPMRRGQSRWTLYKYIKYRCTNVHLYMYKYIYVIYIHICIFVCIFIYVYI